MDGLVGMGTGMELFGMGFRSVVTVSMLWRYGDIGVVPRWSVCRDIIPSASCPVWRRGSDVAVYQTCSVPAVSTAKILHI
jgi:hypothetical protein